MESCCSAVCTRLQIAATASLKRAFLRVFRVILHFDLSLAAPSSLRASASTCKRAARRCTRAWLGRRRTPSARARSPTARADHAPLRTIRSGVRPVSKPATRSTVSVICQRCRRVSWRTTATSPTAAARARQTSFSTTSSRRLARRLAGLSIARDGCLTPVLQCICSADLLQLLLVHCQRQLFDQPVHGRLQRSDYLCQRCVGVHNL